MGCLCFLGVPCFVRFIFVRESGFDFEVTKITRIVSLDKLVLNRVRKTHI